jgi:hypothetical protein
MEINIRKYILGIKYIHRDEIEKNPQIQERELKEEFNETTYLN